MRRRPRERFRAEAEVVARLKHPQIVEIYDIGEADGQPYFALEFIEGGSLAQKLNGAPMPPLPAAALVETLARAMHHAHQGGVLHRDLKPANILLTADGRPKITDFGLAKPLDFDGRTASGEIMGTPSYMPPEQAAGKIKELGASCDIYALGAILYECLTGRPPFRGATPMETVLQVLNEEPRPVRQHNPQALRDLDTICHKCLQKEPAYRYSSALQLAQDLERFRGGDSILARPDSLAQDKPAVPQALATDRDRTAVYRGTGCRTGCVSGWAGRTSGGGTGPATASPSRNRPGRLVAGADRGTGRTNRRDPALPRSGRRRARKTAPEIPRRHPGQDRAAAD